MTAHLVIPALTRNVILPATLSFDVMTTLLKKNLNFQGLIITDGLNMKAIAEHYSPGEAELLALKAGVDIFLCSIDVPKAIDIIEIAILNKDYSEAELDYHVLKILKAKEWVLRQTQEQAAIDDPLSYIIREEAQKIAVEIALRSSILNNGNYPGL